MLSESLLNPNQFQVHSIEVNDNPFDTTQELGMECDKVFVPFETTGTIVRFELRVLTDWEIKHLLCVYISGDQWNPSNDTIFPECKTQEQAKMWTIWSLTSGMVKQEVWALMTGQMNAQTEEYGKVKHELGKILSVYNIKMFCNCLIASVRIATTYQDDIDAVYENWKALKVISKDWHMKVTVKEVARLFNTGIKMVKKTLEVMTQNGIQTAVHPMMRQLCVDHLNLHWPRLMGTWYLDTLLMKMKSKQGNMCAS